ncbi:DUF6278 family protein [Leekyejoonella antrihumi]|uniref:Uncharacterized protein n=1 Tax=Leekyejoonella antrihumi TaxID=1660198 RepID=A0A563DXZ1_9MICO|nr:DUF6278 family protein [Leekyejoonella antrihumi]TWP34841.1 hypothetical protein FGL98_15920 [Leekyejoonella antrihumi]
MPSSWRSWLPGPQHGAARGMAVFGPSGNVDSAQLFDLMGRCEALRAWARDHGVVLDDTPGSLAGLDERVDVWSAEPDIGPRLGHEVGGYLGTVIVTNVPGAAWRAWPNGHPVVRQPSGRDVDVMARAARRIASHHGTLASIYTDSL